MMRVARRASSSSCCWCWRTGCSSRRSSRSSARRARASNIRPHRAAGWRSGSRTFSRIRGGRIATSPRRRSASRSRASAWACTASTCSPSGSRCGSRPFDENRWIAAHAIASVIAVAVLTYLHIVIGEMVPKALALQRADAHGAVRIAGHPGDRRPRSCRSIVGLNAVGNGMLRLIGVRRQEVDVGAVPHDRGAAVHHRGEPGRRPAARRIGRDPA